MRIDVRGSLGGSGKPSKPTKPTSAARRRTSTPPSAKPAHRRPARASSPSSSAATLRSHHIAASPPDAAPDPAARCEPQGHLMTDSKGVSLHRPRLRSPWRCKSFLDEYVRAATPTPSRILLHPQARHLRRVSSRLREHLGAISASSTSATTSANLSCVDDAERAARALLALCQAPTYAPLVEQSREESGFYLSYSAARVCRHVIRANAIAVHKYAGDILYHSRKPSKHPSSLSASSNCPQL